MTNVFVDVIGHGIVPVAEALQIIANRQPALSLPRPQRRSTDCVAS